MNKILPQELAFLAPIVTPGLVRVGSSNDGGYVVPQDAVKSAEVLLSFGVCTDWTFEEDFQRRNPSVVIHAYDHTVSEALFRRSYHKNALKFCIGRGSWSNVTASRALWQSYRAFFPGRATHFEEQINPRYDQDRFATLEKVFGRTISNRVFLKIDIEGSEYGIINDLLTYSARIVGMAFEFHDTMALRETFCSAIRRLQTKFHIVHVHPNNYGYVADDGLPKTLEITFGAGEADGAAPRRLELPLAGLDSLNRSEAPELRLRFAQESFAA